MLDCWFGRFKHTFGFLSFNVARNYDNLLGPFFSFHELGRKRQSDRNRYQIEERECAMRKGGLKIQTNKQ